MENVNPWDPALYDAVLEGRDRAPWEIEVYTALARSVGGPVLELGAGTARVLKELLLKGVDAYGLELDERMAAAGRRKLSAEGRTDASERLLVGDMSSFSHPRRYRLAILPYNTLSLVHDEEGLSALLDCVALHLLPGGEFAFDMVLPETFPYVRPPYEAVPFECQLEVEGVDVRFCERGRYEPESRIVTLTRTFTFSDGLVREIELRLYHWPVPTLERVLQSHGYEFTVPALDERGHPVSETSVIYMARVRRE